MQGGGRGRQTSILNLTASPAVLSVALVDHALLCYAMLCYAMLCYAMLCYAMLCYAMLCYAMLCYAMLWYAICTGVRALVVYLNISNNFLWTCIMACGS